MRIRAHALVPALIVVAVTLSCGDDPPPPTTVVTVPQTSAPLPSLGTVAPPTYPGSVPGSIPGSIPGSVPGSVPLPEEMLPDDGG